MDFIGFPKMARLSREIVITEKIDGTNAQIYILDSMDPFSEKYSNAVAKRAVPDGFGRWELMFAGSRTRWITPTDDNYGFAKWVQENAEDLFNLGPGQHFGEWWGQKIQRGYGLKEKRFSLFNTTRWNEETKPKCCHVVPELYRGDFLPNKIVESLIDLAMHGSKAAPGFMDPEGIVIYHTAANVMFKKTIKDDEKPKGQV